MPPSQTAAMCGDVVLRAASTSEITVLRMSDGGYMGIGGDGHGKGAWAVHLGAK